MSALLRDVKERCYVYFHEARGVAARSQEAALRIRICMFLGTSFLRRAGLVSLGLREPVSAQKVS